MSKQIQVRNVPEDVHGILKARALQDGISLSEYVRRELQRSVERVRHVEPLPAKKASAKIIRELGSAR